MKIDPQTVHVSVPNPDDQFLPPIYEGPANQAHEKITTGQYRALIDDPYTDEPIEVMLHVWTESTTGRGNNSNVYRIPDHLRAYQWSSDFAERVAQIMTEIFGFESSTDTGGQTGVTFTVGTLKFTIGENMVNPGTYAWTQDLTDVGHDGFARVVDDAEISDNECTYRGAWSPWETARQFVRYAVPSFGKIAEKRAANADHV